VRDCEKFQRIGSIPSGIETKTAGSGEGSDGSGEGSDESDGVGVFIEKLIK
jgi:hypothetical protein